MAMNRLNTNKKVILIIIILLIFIGAYQLYHFYQAKNVILILYGNVDIRDVNLSFRVDGRIEDMLFEEGDSVKENAVMAKLDKQPFVDEVNVAKAEVAANEAVLANAKQTYMRNKDLYESGSGSENAYDDAKAALAEADARVNAAKAKLALTYTSLRDTEIFAPATGVILTRVHEPGAIVAKGQTVYVLALNNPVWVRAYITEPQLGYIYPGMKVNVTTDSGGSYVGQIGFISPQAEFTPKSVETKSLRTDLVYRLRVVIENSDHGLRQGMPVSVQIIPKPRKH